MIQDTIGHNTNCSVVVMASRGSPFEPLKLTDEEEKQCYERAFQLLDQTLRSYDERDAPGECGGLHHSKLDGSRWKLLKTQANGSLYVERSNENPNDDFLGELENPVVFLTAGTIRGELDEVMLGLKALDANSISFRTEMPGNHPVDCVVLAELLGPKAVDPFRFLGVTWLMYDNGWPLKSVMQPRDLVTLTATGTMTRDNGDRIGYEVVQTASLPQCPPLSSTVREKAIYAAIFKQQEPGIIDVYIRTYVENHNAILDKIIVGVTWKATLKFWDAPQLAEMKKLQWCIANCRTERQKQQQNSASSCKRCSTGSSIMKRLGSVGQSDRNFCILCSCVLCSECRVDRTLKIPDDTSGRLRDHRIGVCLPCMMFVRQLQPTDIAMMNRKQRSSTTII